MQVKTVIHLSQSIEGALLHWDDEDWSSNVLNDDGSYMNAAKAKSLFIKLKSDGVKVLPIGECPNFDYQKGCQCRVKSMESEE